MLNLVNSYTENITHLEAKLCEIYSVNLTVVMSPYGIYFTNFFQVFRAMDPDLLHRFHTKSCDPSLTPDQMRMCMASLAQAIGSTRQLALKMIDEAAKNKMPRKHT